MAFPEITFAADESTVIVAYGATVYTFYRPLRPPWAYTPVGTTYWVDLVRGSDAAVGTKAAPFASITHALATAQAGDLINVMPGVYVEALAPPTSGTSGKPITLSCAPGALGKVVVAPTFAQYGGNGCVYLNALSYINVNGLVLLGGGNSSDHFADCGVYIANGGGAGVVVQNCIALNHPHCGFKGGVGASYLGNVALSNGFNSNDHGFYLSDNNTVCNGNISGNNAGYGIQSFSTPTGQTIKQNITFGNGFGGILLGGGSLTVKHNTLYGAGGGDKGMFYFRVGCTGNVVKDNIVNSHTTDCGFDVTGGAPSANTDDYNLYTTGCNASVPPGSHELANATAPGLSAPATGDFRLTAGSALKGAGDDGNDLGAFPTGNTLTVL